MKKLIIIILIISLSINSPTLSKEKKYIAITFDDGPSKYTEQLIDILNKHNAKATFFLSGPNIKKYPNSIIKTVSYDNEIGIHTYSHQLFINLSNEQIKEEINKTIIELNNIGLTPSNLVRPPYGSLNNRVINNINTSFILWNNDSNDWLYTNKEKIKNTVKKNLKDGDIILFHDSKEITLEVIEELLVELKDEYNFVTVSELFKIKNISLSTNQKYYSINH